MEAKKNILTYEGLKKYEEELQELKVVKRALIKFCLIMVMAD